MPAAHRIQVTARARFQVPHSGQNTSGSELHADEVVRRPRAGALDAQLAQALLLLLHDAVEDVPPIPLDEKRRTEPQVRSARGLLDHERCDRVTTQHTEALVGGRVEQVGMLWPWPSCSRSSPSTLTRAIARSSTNVTASISVK